MKVLIHKSEILRKFLGIWKKKPNHESIEWTTDSSRTFENETHFIYFVSNEKCLSFSIFCSSSSRICSVILVRQWVDSRLYCYLSSSFISISLAFFYFIGISVFYLFFFVLFSFLSYWSVWFEPENIAHARCTFIGMHKIE